ncbi:MAG: P-II family nitrogen regulator [Dysosmobacter sp.]
MSSPSDIVKRGETAMQGVDLFITITDRSRAEQFAAWFRTHGISLVLTALGQGTATTEVLDFLGLEATEKAVLFCVSPRSPRLVRQAARDLWLDVPGQGVLMTVPVNSIGGSTAKEYLLHEQEGETAMEREIAHDLIVVIANQGSTDLVMDAAREAGATGGTVIHAKGTGTDLVRKFFGVSIASEQEMVFILARSEAKKPIMKAIMAKAGIQSAAQSLVFSCRWVTSPACGSWSSPKPDLNSGAVRA